MNKFNLWIQILNNIFNQEYAFTISKYNLFNYAFKCSIQIIIAIYTNKGFTNVNALHFKKIIFK